MVSNCADLTLSIFLYLTVRSLIGPYNYRFLGMLGMLTGQFAGSLTRFQSCRGLYNSRTVQLAG